MARDTVLAIRLSQVEREKVEQLIKVKGFTTLAECIRYTLDRVHLNEVIRGAWQERQQAHNQ